MFNRSEIVNNTAVVVLDSRALAPPSADTAFWPVPRILKPIAYFVPKEKGRSKCTASLLARVNRKHFEHRGTSAEYAHSLLLHSAHFMLFSSWGAHCNL